MSDIRSVAFRFFGSMPKNRKTHMKAFLRNYRQSPRKVRLVADSIRGKRVGEARSLLSALPKRAALPMLKLLDSALANAKNTKGLSAPSLSVKEIRVDAGPTLKRFMPRAFGRASPINKRGSHISLFLAEQEKGKPQITKPKAQTKSKPLEPRT